MLEKNKKGDRWKKGKEVKGCQVYAPSSSTNAYNITEEIAALWSEMKKNQHRDFQGRNKKAGEEHPKNTRGRNLESFSRESRKGNRQVPKRNIKKLKKKERKHVETNKERPRQASFQQRTSRRNPGVAKRRKRGRRQREIGRNELERHQKRKNTLPKSSAHSEVKGNRSERKESARKKARQTGKSKEPLQRLTGR